MLTIHFLDVGNGDSIVLEHLDENGEKSFGVVDSNRTKSRRSPARDKLLSLGAQRLNFVYLTHPDTDHFSGLFDVLVQYKGKIDQFGSFPFTPIYQDKERLQLYFQKVVELSTKTGDKEVAIKFLEIAQIIKFAYEELIDNWIELTGNYDLLDVSGFKGVTFHSIMPPKKVKGSLVKDLLEGNTPASVFDNNEMSAALAISYAGRSVVLCGDAPREHWEAHSLFREKQGLDLRSVAVKLPHHGSKRDNSKKGLQTLIDDTLSYSIISADGRRHPDFETFEVLDELKAKRLCTGLFQPYAKVKKLSAMSNLSPRLAYYLNVYADIDDASATHCKGDISVSIMPDGSVATKTEFNTICDCVTSFADLFA